MDEELVLLTSYFNLVDGRRQDKADTFRVDSSVPSGTSPDGTAALYLVTESSATGAIGPRARRVATDTVAWEYANHGDTPPAARLKAALRAAHTAVEQEFDGHVSVGMGIIAIEGDMVYLGQVAPAQTYVLHDDSLQSMAAGIEGTSAYSRALGSRAGPRITVYRDQIGPNDVLALTSTWFHRGADAEMLRNCFAAGSADDIAEELLNLAKERGGKDVTAIVIEAITESTYSEEADHEAPPTLNEQVDTAVQALADVGKMLWHELRSAPPTPEREHSSFGYPWERTASTSVDVISAPADEPPYVPPIDWNGTNRDATMEVPVVSSPPAGDPFPRMGHDGMTEEVPIITPEAEPTADQPGNGAHPVTPSGSGVQNESSTPERSATGRAARSPFRSRRRRSIPARRSERVTEEVPAVPGGDGVSELEQVNSRLQDDVDLGGDVIPPVQAFADTSTVEPSRIYATNKDIDAVNRRPRRFSGARRVVEAAGGPRVIRPGDSDVDLRRPVIHDKTPPALAWLGAVALLVLVAAGIFTYLRHRSHATVANPYPALARTDIALAKKATKPATQDFYLAKARQRIGLARASGATAPVILGLRRQLQSTADQLHHVTREYSPTVLTNFADIHNANPSEIAALPGQVFVLDRGRNSVFSVSTASTATAGPSEVARSGEFISSLTASNPVHLAVDATAPGTLLILDDKNQLIRYSGNNKTATTLTQPSPAQLHPAAIATSDPDVYVLDPANNQVWRYALGVTGYSPTFSPYFDIVKPNLSHAVSFVLDGVDLYVLSSDGTIQKFDYQEHPQTFSVSGLPIALSNPTAIYTATGTNSIWVADPTNRRIVQLDKSGKYVRSYMSGSASMHLSQLKSMSLAPTGNAMYVLAGEQLVSFPVAR